MANLKFVDTYNMVAFLSKPTESEGFEQIVDFLNAQPIRYALTVNPNIYISCIKQFWSIGVVKTINREVQLHALVDGKKIIISEASVRRDRKLEDEEDEAVHKELGDSLVRAATTASSLEAEQDNGNITKTRSKATSTESSSLGTTSGGGPKCQETMGDTIAQTRFENISKLSNDSLLARVTVQDDADKEMFDVDTLNGEEVFITEQNENIVEEVVDVAQKPLKKKDQLKLDEEIALKLQAEIDEEERIARAKEEKIDEANIALTEEWDDIQAKIEVDHELAQRLQVEE
ncbi:hypothetical protein Tco_0888804 [Tanacetum coccineum]